MEVRSMLRSKKVFSSLLVLSLIFSMMIGTTAFAQESNAQESNTETVAVVDENARANDTIVGPDRNVYYYLGTATRNGATNYPVKVMLRQTISASEGLHIAFYCPNNNRKDLIQGKVIATPVMGGTVQTFSFLNYYNEVSDIDLSQLSGTGLYRINIEVYAIGTSNSGAVYYRTYK